MEGFTYGKIFGILACFMGAVCVGLNDSEKHEEASGAQTVLGDTVALFGAVFYGLYTTTLKYKVHCAFHHGCLNFVSSLLNCLLRCADSR